ncbi:MAG: peptidylprolyl isomerase [candidate division Zixibacteria bacterium]|nr:peptidylprolyl isomerase [candidate division Zixibacteria bacterium]
MMLLLMVSVVMADGKADKKEKYVKRHADNPEIAIETDFGIMKLELFHDLAPGHADSMVNRIKDGFYDGLIFHRIIDGFMIQGGDPKGTGTGGAGYNINAEFSDVPHLDGTLSMARSQSPNSASSQFFICLGTQAFLDGKYTVFGQVMEGMDVLHTIGKAPCGGPQKSKPNKDVFMRKVTVLKDLPDEKTKKADKK